MEAESLRSLEFEEMRRILAGYVCSPLGRQAALSLGPLPGPAAVEQEFEAFDQCRAWVESCGFPSLSLPEDPQHVLERAGVAGIVLEAAEILSLVNLARIGVEIRALLRPVAEEFPLLSGRFLVLANFSPFIAEMERKILPNGEISDNASTALRQVRRAVEAARSKIQDILRHYLQKDAGGVLQDQFITERNGRYVLPVRTDSPRRIEGVVHGTSSSGATLFVEPLKTVDLNNQLFRLQEQEREEILRILRDISDRIHGQLSDWLRLMTAVAYMDLLTAKVRFAHAYQAVSPRLSTEGHLHLVDARHPLLIEQSHHAAVKVVPISVAMDSMRRVLILSGPNTGGKTVALKTVGLLALLAASGLPVTAAEAVIPMYTQILVDIGDQQSIQSNLSTFSAHLMGLRHIVERATPLSLVLLDEVGTGTDPEQGAALAIAVIERLKVAGAMVIATTHYNRLKAYGYQGDGVANMAVEFDTRTMSPTYRLIDGVAGGSSGLDIAARLGMDPAVIEAARKLVDPRDLDADLQFEGIRRKLAEVEQLRQDLGLERQMAERERLELHSEYNSRREKLETEIRRRFEDQLKTFKVEADIALRAVRNEVDRHRLRKASERRLEHIKAKVQKATLAPGGSAAAGVKDAADRELRAGDRVRILSLEQEGVVERTDPSKVEVSLSGKRWRIDRQDLELIFEPGAARRKSGSREIASGVVLEVDEAAEVPRELNLIGCKVDEALERTDKYLDQAVVANRRILRLVHGHGKGILRNALAGFLAAHPHVAKIRAAAAEEGGQAVTVVELKT